MALLLAGIDRRSLQRDLRPVLWLSTMTIGIFFGCFGGWAALAPLDSAAIASGTVSPDGNRRTVQHLEGGIVREIKVRDDQHVRAGDVLLVLEDTRARSDRDLLQAQHDALSARQARLAAEQTGADAVAFPVELQRRAQLAAGANLLDGERRLFDVRRQSLRERQLILGQRIAELEEEIAGLERIVAARDRELGLVEEEVGLVEDLFERGYERKPRLLALRRRAAEIEGGRAEHMADIARARQAIQEARLQISNLQTERHDQVATELAEVRAETLTVQERLLASQDVLRRTEVTAPVDGRVVELRHHTTGGVIAPGEVILDIVPDHDELLIDTRISPHDIDVVRAGMIAQIRLLAYHQGDMPRIDGKVRQVSADSILDRETGERYYMARVAVPEGKLVNLPTGVALGAGMPAEVMIITGERTLLEYLGEPLLRSLRHAFRED